MDEASAHHLRQFEDRGLEIAERTRATEQYQTTLSDAACIYRWASDQLAKSSGDAERTFELQSPTGKVRVAVTCKRDKDSIVYALRPAELENKRENYFTEVIYGPNVENLTVAYREHVFQFDDALPKQVSLSQNLFETTDTDEAFKFRDDIHGHVKTTIHVLHDVAEILRDEQEVLE